MTSIEERLQIKREPLDKWSIREQLCLSVARFSDQNLTSVSRALKPFGEPNRPTDWFHQKNCAAQYGALLANVETPKRKKKSTGGIEGPIETPAEIILRKLLSERQAELKKLLAEEKAEYLKLQKDLTILQAGGVSEEQLDIWCKELDEEEQKKEQETTAYDQWLREREQRKLEIERAWRPSKPAPITGLKRKNSESLDVPTEGENPEEAKPQEPPRPALSPLLTSLLKSPSQVLPSVTTSSILHSAITNQRPTSTNTNPMIASLLNANTGVTVSPGLQQLVSSALGQETAEESAEGEQSTTDILDDPNLQVLKIDDLASSILNQNGPLPEMKNDVDVIISDLIDHADDIVTDPEQHLQLDGNGDISLMELDLEESEPPPDQPKEPEPIVEKAPPSIDPFEFQDELEFEPAKPLITTPIKQVETPKSVSPIDFVPSEAPSEEIVSPETNNSEESKSPITEEIEEEPPVKEEPAEEPTEETTVSEPTPSPPSVEIVEVVVIDDESNDKEKKDEVVNIEPAEEEPKVEVKEEKPEEVVEKVKTVPEEKVVEETINTPAKIKEQPAEPIDLDPTMEPIKSDVKVATPDFTEELYDDVTMEVKVDKSGKAKRDYSRTKKREEKEFDMLLVMEKAPPDEAEAVDETFSDFSEVDRKDAKTKIKSETERSNSPWTEEDEMRARSRRLSTPATPNDSIPGSPVSSIYYYDDDRDYRNWKKSVMLVFNTLAANKCASLFSKPITDDHAPGYHNVVYRPMDLQTIRRNIENGTIRTTQEFQRDVLLMFTNAIMYNKTNQTVYKMAQQMQLESLQEIQILVQAQEQVDDKPARRETRTSEPGLKRKRGHEENTRNKKRKED